MYRRVLSLLIALILLPCSLVWGQQTGAIEGRVTDAETGDPLPGVNVAIEGTQRGAATGVDGTYEITGVEAGTYTLLASFVGYAQATRRGVEVQAGETTTVNFDLRWQAALLDEVVAVGYGERERQDVTGAVTSIKTEDFDDIPEPNVEQLLRGKAAGVFVTSNSGRPGASATIRIRGGNSISASNEPLYVIDGFVGANPRTLNPSDVESIEVLKDASAKAIYGARGSNGVILISTKRGREGESRLNVNVSQGWQRVANTYELLSGPELARWANAYNEDQGQPILFENPDAVPNTNWQDAALQTAPTTDANLSIRGGSGGTRYFFSSSLFDQKGIVRGSGLQRLQARLNLDMDVNSRLNVGVNSNFSRSRRDRASSSFYDAVTAFPFLPVFEEDGRFTGINPFTGRVENNPEALRQITSQLQHTNLRANLFGEYRLLEGLNLKTTVGGDFAFGKDNRYFPSTLPTLERNRRGGNAEVSNNSALTLLNENTLTYDRVFGRHSVNTVLGATYQHFANESSYSAAEGFASDIYSFNNLGAGDPTRFTVNSSYTDWAVLSFLGRVNYKYADKYLFTATTRRDGSSRLGANNKWAFFPSAAVAWRLSQEPFIRDLGLFSSLKLRASLGVTGNEALGPYETLSSLSVVTPIIGGQETTGLTMGSLANPDLRWETTRELDVGLEAGFFDGRLETSVDYYYKRTNDLLLEVEVPQQTGYDRFLTNIGETENQGVELQINSTNVVTSDFFWSTGLNISHNRNKVLDLGGPDSRVTYRYNRHGGNSKVSELFVGEPIGTFVGAVYMGVWQSQEEIEQVGTMPGAKPGYARYADINEDGEFTRDDDFTIIGDPNPDFHGGFTNTFQYKGFSLSTFFQFSYGNDVMNLATADLLLGSFSTNHLRRMTEEQWTEENPQGTLPKPGAYEQFRNVTSTLYVEDGSFLRLESLTLSYSAPGSALGLSSWQGARVYVNGRNLWLLTGYSGLDPEGSLEGAHPVVQGIDRGLYPRARTISLGVELTF